MQDIPSFTIDHLRLEPGIYVSRVDRVGGDAVTTFDVRMKRPNRDEPVAAAALHTIEHLVATYLRNDPEWRDRIVYWGPMGCLTGNYLLVKGTVAPLEVRDAVLRAFRFVCDFDGEVPGAAPEACGNWRLHDLAGAKREASAYVTALESGEAHYEYPQR